MAEPISSWDEGDAGKRGGWWLTARLYGHVFMVEALQFAVRNDHDNIRVSCACARALFTPPPTSKPAATCVRAARAVDDDPVSERQRKVAPSRTWPRRTIEYARRHCSSRGCALKQRRNRQSHVEL